MQNSPPIGCTKDDLDTPALCLDLDLMESNIRTMSATCQEHGIDWRPHAKCHKSSWIARKLVQAGAIGVTCAKLGEAEVMAAGGVHDLLIANMIVGSKKLARLAELSRTADVVVCIDSLDHARAISSAMQSAQTSVRVIIEIDIGLNRVGVLPGQPALALARRIIDLPGIKFAGVMAYEGHLLRVEDQVEKEDSIRAAIGSAVDTKRLLEENGVACSIMSCGGTGSYVHTVKIPGVTELQAGGAIFMDAFYREQCKVDRLDDALTAISTIVSCPAPGRAIMDAGRKTLNCEIHEPKVINPPDIDVVRLSAEHGILAYTPETTEVQIGDRIELITGYADLTVNLHDHIYGFRNNILETIIQIEARGKV